MRGVVLAATGDATRLFSRAGDVLLLSCRDMVGNA